MEKKLEDIIKRLDAIEGKHKETEEKGKKKAFMDKYGAKFSGDEGIGTAILAELNRQGIDTSIADDAVQDMLSQLREDYSQMLNKINIDLKQKREEISEAMDTMESLSKSIEKASGSKADAAVNPEQAASEIINGTGQPSSDPAMGGASLSDPNLMGDMGGAPPPDAGGMDMGGAPPPDAGGMDMGGAPPPDAGGDPNAMLSDERLKVKKEIPDIKEETDLIKEDAPTAETVSDEDIEAAIERLKKYLYDDDRAFADGSNDVVEPVTSEEELEDDEEELEDDEEELEDDEEELEDDEYAYLDDIDETEEDFDEDDDIISPKDYEDSDEEDLPDLVDQDEHGSDDTDFIMDTLYKGKGR